MMMKDIYRGTRKSLVIAAAVAGFTIGIHAAALANTESQCPAGTAIYGGDPNLYPNADATTAAADTLCYHLTAGDGFVTTADTRNDIYAFGFSDVTGVQDSAVMSTGMLNANFPAPTIKMKEGQKVYLSLSNVGMLKRPDLFDPHSVHFHGYPNASTFFDGEPMASVSINMGETFTYFYTGPDPGTYLYHCHVEATEHMQMGMLGNLWVEPKQNENPTGTPGCHTAGNKYVFNDGDCSTRFDVEYPIQLAAFDSKFHNASISIQPLDFAGMADDYPMINGRGYPDTIDTADISNSLGSATQKLHSKINVTAGQRLLLRLSSVATVDFYTIRIMGLTMKVVGKDAKILRSGTGANLYYSTNSVTLGGGETADALVDIPVTAAAGERYFIHVTNMQHLNNGTMVSPDDGFNAKRAMGGMMTEIVVN